MHMDEAVATSYGAAARCHTPSIPIPPISMHMDEVVATSYGAAARCHTPSIPIPPIAYRCGGAHIVPHLNLRPGSYFGIVSGSVFHDFHYFVKITKNNENCSLCIYLLMVFGSLSVKNKLSLFFHYFSLFFIIREKIFSLFFHYFSLFFHYFLISF
jgi:hypothetical protein